MLEGRGWLIFLWSWIRKTFPVREKLLSTRIQVLVLCSLIHMLNFHSIMASFRHINFSEESNIHFDAIGIEVENGTLNFTLGQNLYINEDLRNILTNSIYLFQPCCVYFALLWSHSHKNQLSFLIFFISQFTGLGHHNNYFIYYFRLLVIMSRLGTKPFTNAFHFHSTSSSVLRDYFVVF